MSRAAVNPQTSAQHTNSLAESLALYRDRRLLVIFALGMSSGFPWVLIGSSMSAWLQEAGLTRTAIGFFGSIFAVYTFNFVWAPLVDRLRPPLLGKLGQRRSWILSAQSVILLLMVAIAWTDPETSLFWTSLVALGIALASATQDIAIDAYRIEIIGYDQPARIPHGSAMATSGWWTGFSLPGALAFYLSDLPGWSWGDVYLTLTGVIVLLMLFVMLIREPVTDREARQRGADEDYQHALFGGQALSAEQRFAAWLTATIVEPFKEFFVRNGVRLALAILTFIFLFKVGEAFLGRMSIVFYKELGFTNTQIGTYSKLVGWWVTIIFSVIASLVSARLGIVKGLLIGGIAMAATNFMFSLMAVVGPDTRLFALAVIVDNFTSAFATVSFVAFISYLTSRAYTATQYALMASLGNLGRTLLAGFSGMMVDGMGGDWALFFALTALMVVPSLLMLLWVAQRLRPLMGQHATG
ncbi:MAG: AmpG family muropeptide MFS transporter [Gammaproteobacteria bacterium]